MAYIEFRDICKSYDGENQVLKNIHLDVEKGELVTLLGPSGCGKTTLLRILGGFLEADEGVVIFDDEDIKELPPYKRELNTVFQKYALFPHMTVKQNIEAGLAASGKSKQEKKEIVERLLEQFHIKELENSYPVRISGGQQQRVAFARAIVIQPSCILFDEPLSALDALLREEMRIELRNLITNLGITGIFVTHDQIEAMSMSDAIAVCHAGKVEQYGAPEDVYAAPATEFVAKFIGSSNWIDEHHMFRPEQADTLPQDDTVRFDTTVKSVQFLGSSYQQQLEYKGKEWSYISHQKNAIGSVLSLYLPKAAIVTV